MWKRGTIIIGILSIILYFCFSQRERYASILLTLEDLRNSYDFIIVGGGSSGSVLAARLSEVKNYHVLLIEKGDEASYASYVPIFAPLQGLFDPTWEYESEPQRNSHYGYKDRISKITRGKSLGGSGHYNYHIISNETFEYCTESIRNRVRSKGSPYHILSSRLGDDKLAQAFLSEEARFPGWNFETILQGIYKGKRFSNFDAYLKPALNRKNLHVLINTEVIKIDFKDKSPESLHITHQKEGKTIKLNNIKKLILAGGAINTPKLLFESGVGPKDQINKLNVTLVEDIPVGNELQDHLTCPLYFHLKNDTGSVNLANLINPQEIWKYLLHKEGIYSTSALSVQAIDPQKDTSILIYNVGAPHKDIYIKLSGMRPDTFDETFPSNTDPWKKGFIFLAGCTKPKSIGRIFMHPNRTMSIDPNYLHNSKDTSCTIKAIQTAVDIGNGKAFKKLGAQLHYPNYKECTDLEQSFQNPQYVECVAKSSCMTKYHPTSTTPLDVIVDRNFKVKGLNNIFIVDGGVLPRGSFMYPNSVITDMAECASEVFKDNL
nr:neither inactivation nor afterpotential protein G-like isoform X1 [Lepeophtheirus salmonis]XP_040565878.1 neither inactivation nor afterpotential protein G-like isoform X1 [Lepeophtheirus salmonis]